MSLKTKKRFKNLGKTIGIGLFALVMFTNIKIAMLDDNELAKGDISVLGIEVTLFDATFANEGPWQYGWRSYYYEFFVCTRPTSIYTHDCLCI